MKVNCRLREPKMSANESTKQASPMPRRIFLRVLGATGMAAAFPGSNIFRRLSSNAPRGGPVVAFHMDQLYLDWSGKARAYVPPVGPRSAEILGQLTDEQLRWSFTYI